MPTDRIQLSVGRPPLFAISILSATALAYELLLIRLFSIVQWHHFAYMIISLALLGYGASGTFLAVMQHRLLPHYRGVFLAHLGVFGVSLLPCYLLAQSISFNPEQMLWDWRQAWRLTPVYLLLSLPFFFAANAIALTFASFRPLIDRVYAVDLLGAGAGSLIVVLLLNLLPPLEVLTILSVCGIGCLGFAAFELPLKQRPLIIGLTLLLIASALWAGTHASLSLSPYKDLSQSRRISGAELQQQRSSALAQLSIVANDTVPLRYAPGMSISAFTLPPSQLALFADGNSLGAITDSSGPRQNLAFLDQLAAALPYHLKTADHVLVLGSGGGMELLQALHQGANRIDAVELNPQVIDLVNSQFSKDTEGLYRHPAITVYSEEARGFVNRTENRYDLIILPPQDGAGGSASGLYALNENYLYTTEALQSYANSLKPDGYLVFQQWLLLPPRNTLRLFATAVQSLKDMGVSAPGNQLALIRGWQTSMLIMKNTAFTAAELTALRTFCASRSFDLAWLPGLGEDEPNRFNRLQRPDLFLGATQLLGENHAGYIERYKFDIRPTDDDRPYFSNFFKWSTLGEILALREKGGLALFDAGYPVLLLTLLQALVFSTLLILMPLIASRPRLAHAAGNDRLPALVVYFSAIGLAFLFIEIAFIQKFMRFLHHPVITVSVTLAAFLVFAGTGSLWLRNLRKKQTSGLLTFVPAVAITLLCLFYLLSLDSLFTSLAHLSLTQRTIVSIILIAPLGFFMGMPFPLVLMQIGRTTPHLIPLAWGVNGCASVLSAALATLLAVHFGFTLVILLALGLYLLAASIWSTGNTGC